MTSVLGGLDSSLCAKKALPNRVGVQPTLDIESAEIHVARGSCHVQNCTTSHVFLDIHSLGDEVLRRIKVRIAECRIPEERKAVCTTFVETSRLFRNHPFHISQRAEHHRRW